MKVDELIDQGIESGKLTIVNHLKRQGFYQIKYIKTGDKVLIKSVKKTYSPEGIKQEMKGEVVNPSEDKLAELKGYIKFISRRATKVNARENSNGTTIIEIY